MLLHSLLRTLPCVRACARRLSVYFTALAFLLLTVAAPRAFAGPTACNILYTIQPQNSSAFGASITIENTGTTALSSWTLTWSFANGQTISSLWNGAETQSGANVTVNNESYNGSIAAGASLTGIGFNGTWNGSTNAVPTAFSLSGTACSVNGSGSTGGSGSFSLKASASSLSITKGGSGTDTITVTDVSPFSGSVTLAASGLPTGVTAAFSANPATGSSVLTLTASSTATATTSTVTINGTSGSLSASAAIALTVTSASTGSFTLQPAASSLSVTQGESDTDSISVVDSSPFSGSVTLAASGLPAGVSSGFSTNPTTNSSTLTLTASSTATVGTSTVTVKGTSGSLSASANIALTVTQAGGGTAPNDGIPIPSAGVALQGVTAGPITILNWGGFKAATSWTFDDSQPSQIEHFADIQAVGVPVTYYIVSGLHTDDSSYDATWTQAAEDGDELGNHTQDHCQANFTNCLATPSTGNLVTELSDDTSYILSHYPQKAVWTGASPYGDTGYDIDASSDFFIYRGVQGGSMLPNDSTNPFDVPCHLAAQGETAAQFNSVTDAARSAGAWQIFLIHTITPTSAIWYNPVAVTDVTGAMTHAKTAGDTWVDSVVDVGAYWRGLKVLATANRTTSGVTTTWTWTLPANFPSGKYLRVIVPGGGTLSQNGAAIAENPNGFFSVALSAGTLTLVQ